jgi:glycine/D-amino acid oxidase-like deaminating enzyme
MTPDYDAAIVGGGFYGAAIAVYLAKQRGLKHIVLIEREPALMLRASYNNQARIHNGYHYPRSFTTAYRSRVNLPRFLQDWPQAVKQDFTKLYAIARRNSKVTSLQFERFCRDIGARIDKASPTLQALFEPRLIEDVFLVQEYAFDSTKLAAWADRELKVAGVDRRFNAQVTAISAGSAKTLALAIRTVKGDEESVSAQYVFNCTYSALNQFKGDFPGTKTGLKQEITEMALVRVPPVLESLGITVMDGPFFSVMPFPARDLHTLSHVRYTPHMHWNDKEGIDPYRKLRDYDQSTRVDRMVRDVARYLPVMLDAKYVDSLFEVKTTLVKNEGDDGRPILFERHPELPGCYSILGGKIDNIYDAFEKLDSERFLSAPV